MKIVNLTAHAPTQDQLDAGVEDLPGFARDELQGLLRFHLPPSPEELRHRAEMIAKLAAESRATEASIGGAPYLMPALAHALKRRGIRTLFAFSRRESVEEEGPDGAVVKRSVFKHVGWVEG